MQNVIVIGPLTMKIHWGLADAAPLPNLNMSKKPSPIRVKDSIKTFKMTVCIWKNKANLSLDILISIALYYNTRGTP